LLEKVRRKCEELVESGDLKPEKGYGSYKGELRGNILFLGAYLRVIDSVVEMAEKLERIQTEVLVSLMLGLTRLCTFHAWF
jgi:hypothetical protein